VEDIKELNLRPVINYNYMDSWVCSISALPVTDTCVIGEV